MKIYIVFMKRWSVKPHSYILSAHKTKEEAEQAGKVEEQDRDGKYVSTIEEVELS